MNETQRRQRGLSSRAKTPRVETPRPEIELDLYGVPRLIQAEPIKPAGSTEGPKLADIRGSVTPGSSEAAASNLGEGASMDAAGRFRPGAGFPEGITRPGDYPVLSDGEVNPPEPISDKMRSAKQLAEKYGEETAEDKAMAIWAKSNPTLAAKVKPGQSGYAAIQKALGKTPEAAPKEVEALVADSGYSAEEAKNRLEGGATEVVFEKGKEPVATVVDPQAFLSNAIGNLGNLNPFDAAVTSTTPTSTLAPPPNAQFTGLNIDAIGSYMTPENEDMLKNLFPGAGGLNLRTGAR